MDYRAEYQKWLNSPALSEAEKQDLRSIAGDDKEIKGRFFDMLEFGTGGLRGIMALGTFHMNIHVIRHVTQAMAELVLEEPGELKDKCIALCRDSRLNGEAFTRAAACVIAANGIHVRLFEGGRPTPQLSFAVREYGCIAGINVTASHNPKEYNGYKAYWADGAQLPPQHASVVARKMNEIDIFDGIKTMDYDEAVAKGLIIIMGKETDELFLKNVMAQANDPAIVKNVADTFKLVYTPFHGVGRDLVPEALRRLGLKHIICEPEQMKLDGTFPTVVSPNPENPEGFELSIKLARENGADLIIGNDPDADRVGIMVRNTAGDYIPLTGNQVGVLLLDYVVGAKQRGGNMPENPVTLKSLVTTEMARVISERRGVKCFDTFTGFKFMAEKKNTLEASGEGKVVYSFEESYGYMIGDFARDKDAVTASMLIAEMAAWYAGQGMTLYDAINKLYEEYGYYAEKTINLVMPGLDGLEKMAKLMVNLRSNPPASIAKVGVAAIRDYQEGTEKDTSTGAVKTIELSGSNVMRFELADGTSVIVRPSGTEPKVKVYVLASGKDMAECDEKTAKYSAWAQTLTEL